MGAVHEFKPRILGFLCNWCSYAGADLCGVSRYQYPASMKVIRLMCSGRVDLEFVLRAFTNGNDGVFIGGCWLGECHYITEGNYDALSTMHLGKKLLEATGLKLEAIRKLLPYVKLVEREKLRVRFENKAEYERFFASAELKSLFNELIADKLAISQIMVLLAGQALSSGEIADSLGMSRSEVSKHLNSS